VGIIMAVKERIHIYSSSDLKKWTFESEFGAGIGAHGAFGSVLTFSC